VLRRVLSTLVAAVALLQPASPTFAYELVAVPALTGRVIDQTGTLSAAERADLDNRLAALERRKGSQIAVLVVATVRPESIEQYAIRVAETWKLGRKGVDDGLLLVVAKDDREVRIEVGYGLEGAIPDATANRVIDEYLVPAFRAGDYARGIGAAVDRLIALVDGEPLPEPPAESAGGRGDLLPFIFMLAVVAGSVFRKLLGQLPGALATSAVVSGATWLLIGALGITLLMALVGFVVGMSAGGRRAGWVSRGRGGFGGGFGARSGGGFSGGGGGFGGGGASGRW
jgi:uncharacterized protein